MSNKIIDFKYQEELNNDFLDDFKNSSVSKVVENLHVTIAFPPTFRTYIDYSKDSIISSIVKNSKSEEDSIFLMMPDVNTFDTTEIFIFQESILKTIEFQYDKIKGKGSYKKDLAKFHSQKHKGNLYNSPEPIEFDKLKETVSNFNKPLKTQSEENFRNRLQDELPNSIKLMFYNNNYLDTMNSVSKMSFVSDPNKSQTMSDNASYLADKENKISDYIKEDSNDESVTFLAKVLKSSSLNKGFVAEDYINANKDKSLSLIIDEHISFIGNNLPGFKQSRNFIEKRFKEEITLKDLPDNNTSTKFKEFERLKSYSDLYMDMHHKYLKAKSDYFLKDDPSDDIKEELKEDELHIEFLQNRFQKINDKCLDYLINGGSYVVEKDNNVEKVKKLSENIDPEMPEFLKGMLKDVLQKNEKLNSEPCDCFTCYYEEQIDKLALL